MIKDVWSTLAGKMMSRAKSASKIEVFSLLQHKSVTKTALRDCCYMLYDEDGGTNKYRVPMPNDEHDHRAKPMLNEDNCTIPFNGTVVQVQPEGMKETVPGDSNTRYVESFRNPEPLRRTGDTPPVGDNEYQKRLDYFNRIGALPSCVAPTRFTLGSPIQVDEATGGIYFNKYIAAEHAALVVEIGAALATFPGCGACGGRTTSRCRGRGRAPSRRRPRRRRSSSARRRGRSPSGWTRAARRRCAGPGRATARRAARRRRRRRGRATTARTAPPTTRTSATSARAQPPVSGPPPTGSIGRRRRLERGDDDLDSSDSNDDDDNDDMEAKTEAHSADVRSRAMQRAAQLKDSAGVSSLIYTWDMSLIYFTICAIRTLHDDAKPMRERCVRRWGKVFPKMTVNRREGARARGHAFRPRTSPRTCTCRR